MQQKILVTRQSVKITKVPLNDKSFTLIVFAYPYCARIFTRHAMHERALSNGMNNDRVDSHCYRFPGFNDLGRSVTPIFLLMDHFLYQFFCF